MQKNFLNQSDTDWVSLLILTFAAMLFVTAELLPVGVLPEISSSFQEPIGKVGLMVTGYAWTVGLSAVLMTMWLATIERQKILLVITLLFSVSNLLLAYSPSLLIVFVARIAAAFSHGIFWSILGPVCIRLSGSLTKTRATALVFGGITLATVVGIPAGTMLAQKLGWRVLFEYISFLSLIIAAAIFFHFPRLTNHRNNSLAQLWKLRNDPLLQKLYPATVLAITGHFFAFTYISILLEKSIRVMPSDLSFYLFVFGGAGIGGNILASKVPDHHLHSASQWSLMILIMVMTLYACIPPGAIVMPLLLMMIWGASICFLTITLQSLVLTLSFQIAEIASAVYVSIFNVGIGGGALLGSFFIAHSSSQIMFLISGIILLIATIIYK